LLQEIYVSSILKNEATYPGTKVDSDIAIMANYRKSSAEVNKLPVFMTKGFIVGSMPHIRK